MSTFLPKSVHLYQKQPKTTVEMQNLWKVMDDLQALAEVVFVEDELTGYVQSVTDDGNGVVSVNNADTQNPIIEFNGVNIGAGLTGDGTSGAPLVATAVGLTDGDKGDITVSGTGTVWTIDNDAVTFAKMQNISTDVLLGRDTAGSGNTEEITIGTGLALSGAGVLNCTVSTYTNEEAQDAVGGILTDTTTIDFTYNDGVPSITADVINDSITFAKMQNISTDRLIGRDTAASGDPEEIALGNGLTFSGSQVINPVTQMSITTDASGFKLSGDATSPGNWQLYGTNSAGTKGFSGQRFRIHVGHYATSFADSTVLYFAGSAFLPTTANADQWGVRAPRACRILEAHVVFSSATVIGSNENISMYVRHNNTTNYLIATVGTTDRARVFSNTSLNAGAGIDLATNDYVCIQITPPVWATNPTNTHCDGYLELIYL